jgi:hypothetical protein
VGFSFTTAPHNIIGIPKRTGPQSSLSRIRSPLGIGLLLLDGSARLLQPGNGMLIVANKHDNFMKTLRDIGEGKKTSFCRVN